MAIVMCQGENPLAHGKERGGPHLAEAAAEELHARVEVPSLPCNHTLTCQHVQLRVFLKLPSIGSWNMSSAVFAAF